MLDAETKRRIDTARDILVGKVPDPKSQVEQITIALIYKFMDDLDAESEEFGGARRFFAGEFSRYGWTKLMRSGLGGYEVLNLYAEAINKMPENPGIPPLFRDIFKNAFLPYRDPETLRAFLKIIDEFTYDHSERLGDAFEYLLSVLGSQGDAGQFRTPRHIIDFIVAVIDPKKDETILDPACGTAGFLISSFKHILKSNTDEQGHTTLSPDDKGRLVANFKGYDISPDMVRLSLVNLYLHGFADPHISEYDTLTSEDRWNEYADVILANPPFMSPKGGIRPHNHFSVKSKRSEVLFVDYMAEHLTPSGRAGIIVPEGIIFQSQTAHKQLRKMLVENYLVAVISLPSGVFQPYSGVKTSILILDKVLARKADRIGFFKVENDGFDLGAQRRPIDKNDLPQAQTELAECLRRLRFGESVDDFQPTLGMIVKKGEIAADGAYNLIGERYRKHGVRESRFPIVTLEEVCELYQPKTITRKDLVSDGPYLVFGANGIIGRYKHYNHENAEVIITCRGATSGTVNMSSPKSWITGNAMVAKPRNKRLCKGFLFVVLRESDLSSVISGSAQPQITRESLSPFTIPLPPLEVQQEIVAKIEGFQKVIDGARAVIDNYRPHIPIDPAWPMVELGDVCNVFNGSTPSRKEAGYWENGTVPWFTVDDIRKNGRIVRETIQYTTNRALKETSLKLLPRNTVLLCCTASVGECAFSEIELTTNQQFNGLVVKTCFSEQLLPKYLFHLSTQFKDELLRLSGKTSFNFVSGGTLKKIKFPLPPHATQQAIVAEIEAEQALVSANGELMGWMERKIAAAIGRVWCDAGN